MSEPKRHHYVPSFLLANFVDSDGKIHVRRAEDSKVWSSVPDNTYLERHRYSSIDDQGSHDTTLEKAYAELESAAKPVIDKFIGGGRAKTVPTFSPEEKATWDEFVYHQMKRVPEVTKKLADKRSWPERIEDSLSKAAEMGWVIDEATLDEFRSPERLDKIRQNATVKALAADSPLVRQILSAANFEIGVALEDKFVIGSRPVAMADYGLRQAEAGKTAMWFPIASDIAVRPKFDSGSSVVELGTVQVREINEHILRQSDYVAGESKTLLESLPVSTPDT